MIELPPDVIAAAQAAEAKWKIPASVQLGQYGLESGWGEHEPEGSNNPFGIKALPGEPAVDAATHEYVAGRFVTVSAPFRAFPSIADAFDAHASLLATSPHYSIARKALPSVQGFCEGLTGTYATDPTYGQKLWSLICAEQLCRFDALDPRKEG